MQKFLILLKADYALIALLIGAAICLIGTPVARLIGNSLMFTAFDAQGYFKTLQRRETNDKTEDPEIIASYRVIQLQYQIALLTNAYLFDGWQTPVAMLIWHFAGINDLLYYRLLKQKIPNQFTWLYWTPIGFVYEKLLQKPTPVMAEYIQAGIGLLLSLFTIFTSFTF